MLAVLRERFGHASLFPIQEQVVRRVLTGGDALVVLPTGSGKSLCYQLPALCLDGPGTTLVFSPLIALMEDQVAALRRKGVHAQYINSTLTRAERERRYARVAEGAYELVYATPERMHKPEFRAALERLPGGVRLLAVDEAHCITKWGHDFRPAYQEVGEFRELLGSPPTVALTATATAEVRADIRATLGLDETAMPLFVSGIDRPNLAFEVHDVWDDGAKLDAIADLAARCPGTGIVYFSLIKDLDRYAGSLRERGLDVRIAVYHGQLPPEKKKKVLDRFVRATPSERLLLLATNAFGMGVDKPDIRFIAHAQVPGSVEAYYQEVGRAGRDGKPSVCALLYCEDDLAIQQSFVEWLNPSPQLLRDTADAARRWPHGDFEADDVREPVVGRNRGDRRLESCLLQLTRLGVLEEGSRPDTWRYLRGLEPDELSEDVIAEKRQRDLQRLLDMVKLVKGGDVRAFVLDYFGLDGG